MITRLVIVATLLVGAASAAVCTGADPCKACKDCSACHYCDPKNPKGGSCGVCRNQDAKAAAKRLRR